MSQGKQKILWVRACLVLAFGLSPTNFALAYSTAQHEDICTKAEILYQNCQAPHQQNPPGRWFLEGYGNTIRESTVAEDSTDYGNPDGWFPFFNHFYDPNRPTCLMLPFTQLGMYETAMHRAQRFEDICLSSYRQFEGNEVADLVGRISHLIADMGVPAHVHLTPHGTSEIERPESWPDSWPFPTFPYWRDWYEEDYISGNTAGLIPLLSSGYPMVTQMHDVIDTLSRATSCYPSGCTLYEQKSSGDCFYGAADGDWCSVDSDYCWRTAPWNVPESADAAAFGAEIAADCYINAMKFTAAYWCHFLETVRPTIDSTGLDQDTREVYTEIPRDPVVAHGYGEGGNQAPTTSRWWYSYAAEPGPFPSDDWEEWEADVDDLPHNCEAVSLRCVAFDHCLVDSESRGYTVKYDKTEPTVKRVQ